MAKKNSSESSETEILIQQVLQLKDNETGLFVNLQQFKRRQVSTRETVSILFTICLCIVDFFYF